MSSRAVYRGLLFVVFALCSTGCSEDSPVRDITGTGSAGGNPALTFTYDSTSRYDSVQWQPPVMNVDTIRVAPRADGCDAINPEPFEHDGEITFDGSSEVLFDGAIPCAVDFVPPIGAPLLSFDAVVDETKSLRVELWLDWGIEIVFDTDAETATAEDVFLVFESDRMLDDIDFRDQLATSDDVVISNRSPFVDPDEAMRLQTNLIAATRVYLDPSPGDGRLQQYERVPENVVGFLRVFSQPPEMVPRASRKNP